MLSLTANPPKAFSLSSPFLSPHPLPSPHPIKPSHNPTKPLSISALIIPPSSSYPTQKPVQKQLYQPFRPPASPVPPKYRGLDAESRLDILTNRLGLWFEYAPLIPSLVQEGFQPDILEEITGISGVEQNRLVVAAKVRESVVESNVDPDVLSFFDTGGAELLYEIRLLSNRQRAAAVKYVVERGFDAKKTEELARAMKDKPRRRGDEGWGAFDNDLPGDCLAFMYYRQAQEHLSASSEEARIAALERALEFVETDSARKAVLEDLEGRGDGEKGEEGRVDDGVRVPVVRMKVGEAAEASVLVVLPVCRQEEREAEVLEAPWECKGAGEFGVVEAEKGWSRWVVLPGWVPIARLKRGGVAVAFKDARVLPWRAKRLNREEAILVVADRGRKEVTADDGFYLVVGGGNGCAEEGLKVEKGVVLKELGVTECLGTVLLVVRPPRDEDDQISDEEWD